MKRGRIATVALAVGLFAALLFASGETEALLLSCMDYRLVDETERYMSERGLRNRYDHVILAGASLGALTEQYPSWNKTFWDHLDLAVKLHKIKKVVVMDHRDCGAYKILLNDDLSKDRVRETAAHRENLTSLEKKIHEKFPDLEVELLLIDLEGKVDVIGDDRSLSKKP